MLKRYLIGAKVNLRRVDAGLPRRKICIRAVRHIFRMKDESPENDDETEQQA